ncbi:SEC-C metal-binding domain-containing protein [Sphingomonas sp. DBB INV C78]|uniref:SEC-C metal-binding domain-containing protein n=1 Tax=Sphingomonas sp. DBB INV C78 TaxID=3349434 RepID=UPI0036D3D097
MRGRICCRQFSPEPMGKIGNSITRLHHEREREGLSVKRGLRSIRGGQVELLEKLGRNDPCPCLSGKRLQALLHEIAQPPTPLSENAHIAAIQSSLLTA